MFYDSEQTYYLTRDAVVFFKDELKKLQASRIKMAKEGEEHTELDLLDKKIEDTMKILQSHEVIAIPPKEERDIVSLGAIVKVKSGSKVSEFTIVGTLEANPLSGKVSNESPVGKALLGKRMGDEVEVRPGSQVRYKITGITYG
jgi:transcription elongation factor GreA